MPVTRCCASGESIEVVAERLAAFRADVIGEAAAGAPFLMLPFGQVQSAGHRSTTGDRDVLGTAVVFGGRYGD